MGMIYPLVNLRNVMEKLMMCNDLPVKRCDMLVSLMLPILEAACCASVESGSPDPNVARVFLLPFHCCRWERGAV